MPATCPALTGGANATDCNVVLTINANGTVTTTSPFTTPYDGSDDQYVAIVNNTSGALNHFYLTGPAIPLNNGIFAGMDGDGVCEPVSGSFGFSSSLNCAGTSGNNYATHGVTFTPDAGGNSGYVDFAGGLAANGGIGIFSLEEPASIGSITITSEGVPEPITLSLFGAGLFGAAALRRRRRKA